MEYSFLASYVLIIIALGVSYRYDFGLEKMMFKNSLLAMIQLGVLGYALAFIFQIENCFLLFALLAGMVTFGAYTASKRVRVGGRNFYLAWQVLGLASGLVFFSMVVIGVVHWEAREMIPLGGMIIGNALNVYTQSLERFSSEVKSSLSTIEGMMALGANYAQALQEATRKSAKSSLIPTLNMLQTVGIIHIPGVTVGMLLAGADPLKAISYQLVIMYLMVAVALTTAILTPHFFRYRILRSAMD